MTNADCIRHMSDEQLYEFLSEWECGDIDYSVTFCDLCNEATKRGEIGNVLNLDCDGCRKHWLQRDAVDYGGLMYWKKNTTFDTNAERKTESNSEKPNNCEDESKYEMGMGTLKCDNCSEYGSFKCTKCDGEMYFKRLEPKDEPTISKMEQVDKDINVRSKDEPQRDTPTLTADDWKKIKTAMPESRLILFDDDGNAFEPQTERSK